MVSRERGSALIWVLGFIVVLGIVISGTQLVARMAERELYARAELSRAEIAAASAVEALTDQLRALVARRLGNFDPDDLAALQVPAGLQATGAAVRLDTAHTGVRIVDVREWEVIPHDEHVLDAWTHQPRVSWDGLPDVGGSVAARTVEVEVYATAYGPREGRRMATRRLAVSVVAPHQHALYTQGDAEIVGGGPGGLVGGPVRVDGTAWFGAGGYLVHYVGGIEARDGISAAGSRHVVMGTAYPSGAPSLGSLSRLASEASPGGMLAPWQGRVRIRPAVGGSVSPGRMQTASVAGSGECADFEGACFGRGSVRPALTLRRTHAGRDSTFSVACGEAYSDDPGGCAQAASTIRYAPWPFPGAQSAGIAAADPDRPGRIWRGLFPDFRREGSCDASALVGRPYRTFRCTTNAYGFVIEGSRLDSIPGGVLVVRRATGQAGADPSAEVVLIRDAATLKGPLTLVSELPVVIWGSFNVANPRPAMIAAPRITVMPNETQAQLRESLRWDVAPGENDPATRVAPVQARSNVTLFAVLRTGYCRTVGAAYFGGSWEGIPAAAGDWSRAALRVNGSVEGYDQTSAGAAACASYWAPFNAAQPGGVAPVPPFQRSVLFNRRLLHPDGQPPGSYRWENFPATGGIPGAPTRTRDRQRDAFGGITVLRLIQDLRTIPPAARGSAARPARRTTIGPLALPALPPAL
ncbi:MAG TPA: hypothetical protein VF613_13910 [Longimicrobium sp.]|jgi:hypothetical protein